MPEHIVTLAVDDLKVGDSIRLIEAKGPCRVVDVQKLDFGRRILMVKHGRNRTSVWLWKYSRIELLSDAEGRGHIATSVIVE